MHGKPENTYSLLEIFLMFVLLICYADPGRILSFCLTKDDYPFYDVFLPKPEVEIFLEPSELELSFSND